MWYLIVSIPDLCTLTYFKEQNEKNGNEYIVLKVECMYPGAIGVTSGAIYRQLLLLHWNVMMIKINKCDHVEKNTSCFPFRT